MFASYWALGRPVLLVPQELQLNASLLRLVRDEMRGEGGAICLSTQISLLFLSVLKW